MWHSKDLIHWEQICNVMTPENDFRVEKTYGGGGVMAGMFATGQGEDTKNQAAFEWFEMKSE